MLLAVPNTFNEDINSITIRGNNDDDDGTVTIKHSQIKLKTIVSAEPFFSHCWMWI
jgi:hypothetical protein